MRSLFAAMAGLVLVACTGNDIRVFIYGNIGEADLDLEVKRGDETAHEESFNNASLPASFTLSDGDDGSGDEITVIVRGEAGGFDVTRSARLDFDPTRDMVLPMPLCTDCSGAMCEADQTCVRGNCESNKVREADLPDEGSDPSQTECIGGTGGGGGAGGFGPCTANCGTPGCGDCPDPTTTMGVSSGVTIDLKEVTRAAYQDWLATTPQPVPEHPDCANVTDFTPNPDHEATACSGECSGHPQVGVSWCQAYEYCRWANKSLCGSHPQTSGESEWVVACRGGLSSGTMYPYGDSYQGPLCNGLDANYMGTYVAGQNPGCATPDGNITDLSGNVAEWTHDGATNYRGGSWGSPEGQMTCTSVFAAATVTESSDKIGFRCCAL